MNSREKVNQIFSRKNIDEKAMWTGCPKPETVEIYAQKWNIEPTAEAIFSFLGDDCRYINPMHSCYFPENGIKLFKAIDEKDRKSLSQEGCFAEAETIEDIEWYPWPTADSYNFESAYKEIDGFQDKMVFTGIWSPFYHNVADFFGMENYFIQMYENPDLVHEVTRRVVDFYVDGNDRFFKGLGNRADIMFIGNDFGTQKDLMISPELFREFILPYLKQLINVGKKHGKKVMLHSCGSIYRIIPDLIDAGVDILHPLQAQAKGMSAQKLKQYKNDLSFLGGIDAQSFFVNATPQQIKDEVERVRDILGPSIVISPSHESVLPNVPAENILAMAQACK